MNFLPSIRRELNRVCTFDFLARFAPSEDKTQSAKIRLIQRRQSVTALSRKIGYPRNSVSLVIHERRRLPKVEAAVRKELGI